MIREVLRSSSEASNWSDNFGNLGAEAKKGEERPVGQRNSLEAEQAQDGLGAVS